MFRKNLAPFFRRHGKEAFICSLGSRAKLLDVGCGNNSPIRAKQCVADLHYTGLDISDYNQNAGSLQSADVYLVTTPLHFAQEIEALKESFDGVVSSHNLEHCLEPERVLRAMCAAVRRGGRMYVSFPSEASVRFPRRKYNTLNFFDDPTHVLPPKLVEVVRVIEGAGLAIEFQCARYRPVLPMLAGFVLEPVSYATQRAMPFGTTWAMYGFESVIWAKRP